MWMNIRSGFICGWLGMLLAHMGYSFVTWEFWAVFALLIEYGINLAKGE